MTVTLVLNVQRLISHRLNTGRETQESPILDTKEKNNGSHRAFVAPIPFVHEWKIYNVLLDIIIYSMKAVTVTRRLNHWTYKFAPTFLAKSLVFSKENLLFISWNESACQIHTSSGHLTQDFSSHFHAISSTEFEGQSHIWITLFILLLFYTLMLWVFYAANYCSLYMPNVLDKTVNR